MNQAMNLKNKIKNLRYSLLTPFYFNRLAGNKAVILMYHSISDNGGFFCVKPAEFEKQANYLKENNFNVISLERLVELLKNKNGDIPSKTIVLTFDDGFEDNFTNAFPLLKKHNFHFTVFLQSGVVGGIKTNKEGVKYQMLNVSQIKEMSNSGIADFEPHTINHPKLAKIASLDARKEILESKQYLEKEIGKKSDYFAYPFGNYNKEVINMIKNIGFQAAVTVEKGVVKLKDNPFELKRNSIDSAVSFSQFKHIVNFGKI